MAEEKSNSEIILANSQYLAKRPFISGPSAPLQSQPQPPPPKPTTAKSDSQSSSGKGKSRG